MTKGNGFPELDVVVIPVTHIAQNNLRRRYEVLIYRVVIILKN